MKKMLALLLAVCLSASLTACGTPHKGQGTRPEAEDDSKTKETEISLWTYPVGNWGNSVVVAGLISGFMQKYPKIHISVKYLDYTSGDEEIRRAVESGGAPDLVLEGPERLVAAWGDEGLMADLSDLWEEDRIAGNVYEIVRNACRHRNGEYYEFPICMAAHCMAINYDMFEAAGALQYIDEENRTWTTEGFVKAVEALKAYGQEKAGAVYCGGQGATRGRAPWSITCTGEPLQTRSTADIRSTARKISGPWSCCRNWTAFPSNRIWWERTRSRCSATGSSQWHFAGMYPWRSGRPP